MTSTTRAPEQQGTPANKDRPPNAQGGPRRRRWQVLLVALAATAFAAMGIFGVVRYIEAFWLYRGFAAPARPRYVGGAVGRAHRRIPVYAGSVTTLSFASAALGGRTMRALVYLPPNYARDLRTRYPVLYLLHGFPGSPIQFINVGDVAVLSETLLAEGRVKPMIIVMPPGGTSFFSDDEWANSVRPHNDWESYVAHDLVDAIDRHYRAIPSGSERGIGGLSEGGYGALNIAFHHPGEFDLIQAWSPYYVADRSPRFFGHSASLLAYNSPKDEVPLVASALRAHHSYIWLYNGNLEHDTSRSEAFVRELADHHVDVSYSIQPGYHNWQLWRSMMSQSLIVASRYFSDGPPALRGSSADA